MNKQLKVDFENLLESFGLITTYASDYDLKEYLELLENFKGEVDYEVEFIKRELEEDNSNSKFQDKTRG